MVREISRLTSLNGDVLGNIMDRLGGSGLAAASCVCKDLRDVVRDGEAWRRACHSLWPSTTIQETGELISDFDRFYGDSYPLVFYERDEKLAAAKEESAAQDLVSMVDVYYKNECILSVVSVCVPEALTCDDQKMWFSSCPFKWDALNAHQTGSTRSGVAGHVEGDRDCSPAPNTEDTNWRDQTRGLQDDLRLSWVLIDKKKSKAVNLSSWMPISLQRSWPSNGDYRVQFGCIVPVEDTISAHKMAKCTIVSRCSLEDCCRTLELKEISLHIEDLTGAHVNGSTGLVALNKALYCSRTTDQLKVQRGFCHYEKLKKEFIKQKELKETAAIGFFMSIELVVFLALLYVLTLKF